MGLGTRIAIAGLATGLPLCGLGASPAVAAPIVREDTDQTTITITRDGVPITCTVSGRSTLSFDPDTGSTQLSFETRKQGGSACDSGVVLATGTYQRSADGPVLDSGPSLMTTL